MVDKLKSTVPLALVIGVLAFLWCEVSLNFTFHWVTNGDLGGGLHLPASFHLVVVAAFVSWGFFFAAGADKAAFVKVALSCITGGLAGLLAIIVASKIADAPDFWGIALGVMIFAIVLVMMSALGEWHYVPGAFGAFASVFFWWTATGLDFWSPSGGGVGNSVQALADPSTAGAGAFAGVLSTPFQYVWLDTTVSLLIGCVLGITSVTVTAMITPAPKEEVAVDDVVDAPHAHPRPTAPA